MFEMHKLDINKEALEKTASKKYLKQRVISCLYN